MWEQQFLDELNAYLGFTPEHALALKSVGPYVAPHFQSIVDRFYDAIFENPRVAAVITGGAAQIERQKALLRDWLGGLFGGVYDLEYLRLRARIGRTHVRIRLAQRYMFSAMNIVRTGLHRALSEAPLSPDEKRFAHDSVDKICDLELATLGQVSGFIGHELRNPLAVMETSVHLLKRRLPIGDEKATQHLNRLREQIELSTRIISDLLALARDRPIERQAIDDLRRLIDDALAEVPKRPGFDLSVELPPDLPAPSVDESQVRRLLVNLLSNAYQALAEHDAPRVRVSAAREDETLLLVVEDNGPGIAEELRHRLFEPLATTRAKGLGLGLALCRRIAERHSGDIRALQSHLLGGARFEVRLGGAFAAGEALHG